MYLNCQKCLTGRNDDVLGAPCKTPGCDGIIEEVPEFHTLVDLMPEPMTCPRRSEVFSTFLLAKEFPAPDYWQKFKTNGNRVCSYCGSLHPEDMFALVHACATAPEDAPYGSVAEIEPSDKGYKVYVRQPRVRNAHEGGIKFYMQHLPRDGDGNITVTADQNKEYAQAVRATKARFERYLAAMRGQH
jgi:hypothetical protein